MSDQRFFIQREFLWAKFRIYFREVIGRDTGRSEIAYAQPVQLRVRTPEEEGTEAPCMMMVEEGALQTMMDELWKEGFRPKDIGTAGHLAATQAHLGDMKKLVAKAYHVAF